MHFKNKINCHWSGIKANSIDRIRYCDFNEKKRKEMEKSFQNSPIIFEATPPLFSNKNWNKKVTIRNGRKKEEEMKRNIYNFSDWFLTFMEFGHHLDWKKEGNNRIPLALFLSSLLHPHNISIRFPELLSSYNFYSFNHSPIMQSTSSFNLISSPNSCCPQFLSFSTSTGSKATINKAIICIVHHHGCLWKSNKDKCVTQSMAVGKQVTSYAKIRCTNTDGGGASNINCWHRNRFLPSSFLAHLVMNLLVGLKVGFHLRS